MLILHFKTKTVKLKHAQEHDVVHVFLTCKTRQHSKNTLILIVCQHLDAEVGRPTHTFSNSLCRTSGKGQSCFWTPLFVKTRLTADDQSRIYPAGGAACGLGGSHCMLIWVHSAIECSRSKRRGGANKAHGLRLVLLAQGEVAAATSVWSPLSSPAVGSVPLWRYTSK